ncbi:alpha/beta hydrolase-fold protein [Pseudoalteromonas xiamenensis]|uniref:alpha/beta hydrolase n=1 Tax=Pseudoalteromonas xiamenensis TaxID=882626 RepID=UPI0027E449DB|nr:alpha/beta hydrolase-fold protein [Pseudoalteromonas xiamenensis]WMN59477.1 alpha/beta hydrolase-fold protein [Pseudoalteromonas xiamenensis]
MVISKTEGTKKLKILLIIIFLALLPVTWVSANQLGTTFTIHSKHLNEERKIVVSLPSNYKDEPFYKFPVLYLTDASSQLDHTASMIHYLSDGISPMIVVGIFTPDRWNELKPFTRDKQPNPKAESLRKFIVEEVKGFINKNYRTLDYSIFAGHSLGGSFAINAYIKDATDFDVFFALAPNFAMGNEVMFEQLPNAFAHQKQPKVYFQFEGVTPFTTPINSYARLNTMLLKYPLLKTTHKVQLFENEDHMTIPHIGLYRGLTEIYKDWFLYIPSIVEDKKAIKNHFQGLSKRIGYQVNPTESYFRDLIGAMISMEHIDTAAYAAEMAKEFYPESHFSYVLLADVAHAKKNATQEAKWLKKAIMLSSHDVERQSQYQKRLASL